MNTIENLYLGNIRVCERRFPPNLRYVKVQNRVQESKERLMEKLTPEAKELFAEYIETHYDIESLSEREVFTIGFRLGVKLMTDVYSINDGVIRELNKM